MLFFLTIRRGLRVEGQREESAQLGPLLDEPIQLLHEIAPHSMGTAVAVPRVAPERRDISVLRL